MSTFTTRGPSAPVHANHAGEPVFVCRSYPEHTAAAVAAVRRRWAQESRVVVATEPLAD